MSDPGRAAVRSIVGVWRLIREVNWDETGQPVKPLFGPEPTGFVSFQANGLMIVAMTDSRVAAIEGPRGYASYCGSYTFDGKRLVTDVEDGSSEVWRRTPQIRDARFEGEFMILSPPAGALDRKGVTRELTWERIASNPE